MKSIHFLVGYSIGRTDVPTRLRAISLNGVGRCKARISLFDRNFIMFQSKKN
jgi:hypothetical protein